jgi:hypothetical protein
MDARWAKVVEMQVFVPVEDAPSVASTAWLVPYRYGMTCEHGLRDVRAVEASCLDSSARKEPGDRTRGDDVVVQKGQDPADR